MPYWPDATSPFELGLRCFFSVVTEIPNFSSSPKLALQGIVWFLPIDKKNPLIQRGHSLPTYRCPTLVISQSLCWQKQCPVPACSNHWVLSFCRETRQAGFPHHLHSTFPLKAKAVNEGWSLEELNTAPNTSRLEDGHWLLSNLHVYQPVKVLKQ